LSEKNYESIFVNLKVWAFTLKIIYGPYSIIQNIQLNVLLIYSNLNKNKY